MTYLTGITTWGNLLTDMRELICGRKADDLGTTVPVAERWRDGFDPTGGNMVLAPPASTSDRTVSLEHRTGYWNRFDDTCIAVGAPGSETQYVRMTSVWNAWHTNFNEALHLAMVVTTPNTVAHDYTGAVVRIRGFSMPGAGSYQSITSGSTVTLDASGNGTWTYTTGYSMSFKVAHPADGILKTSAYFQRTFTDAYRGGIDSWRGYARRTTAMTYDIAPSGAQGTDWAETGTYAAQHTTSGSSSYVEAPVNGTSTQVAHNFSQGLGIKTNAALTGARYVVTFDYCASSMGLFYLSGQQIFHRHGGVGYTTTASRVSGLEGNQHGGTGFLDPFSGTPVSDTPIQYWIKISPTCFAIVLYGDSDKQGRITGNMIARIDGFDVDDPQDCWAKGYNVMSTSTSSLSSYCYKMGAALPYERAWVKGWRDGGRDWQTGMGRWDFFVHTHGGSAAYDGAAYGFNCVTATLGLTRVLNNDLDSSTNNAWVPTSNTSPSQWVLLQDPHWPLNGWALADFGQDDTVSLGSAGLMRPRGTITEGFFQTWSGSWSTGDELLDTSTGKKYKLFGRSNYIGWISAGGPHLALEMF
jgi:hypothetical protein